MPTKALEFAKSLNHGQCLSKLQELLSRIDMTTLRTGLFFIVPNCVFRELVVLQQYYLTCNSVPQLYNQKSQHMLSFFLSCFWLFLFLTCVVFLNVLVVDKYMLFHDMVFVFVQVIIVTQCDGGVMASPQLCMNASCFY